MKSPLLKHRNLMIFSSCFSIQSMTIIHPVVGKLCNWSYHHIPDPLFRVDVPIPWLLEYPSLTAHRCTTFHRSSAWPRGQPTAGEWLMEEYKAPTLCSYWEHLYKSDWLPSFLQDVQRPQLQSHHDSASPCFPPFLASVSPKSFPQ